MESKKKILNFSDYLIFGGFDNTSKTTDQVALINSTSNELCLGQSLPVALKEAQIFEFNNTLLLCTSFTKLQEKELQCFIWIPPFDGNTDACSGNHTFTNWNEVEHAIILLCLAKSMQERMNFENPFVSVEVIQFGSSRLNWLCSFAKFFFRY